jgi:hypothetical protein
MCALAACEFRAKPLPPGGVRAPAQTHGRTGGRADGRTGGRADGRTGGRTEHGASPNCLLRCGPLPACAPARNPQAQRSQVPTRCSRNGEIKTSLTERLGNVLSGLVFVSCPVRFSAILNKVLRIFFQLLQADARIIPLLGHQRFLSTPFQFIIHRSSYHSAPRGRQVLSMDSSFYRFLDWLIRRP